MLASTIVLCIVISVTQCTHSFPPGFKFGAASAAHQIEGAWNVSDKSPNIWDVYSHKTHHKEGTGDVACDSYHQWKQDVKAAKDLGLDYYRFSISWTRLLPSGFPNHVSEGGKRYYSDLIDALLQNGIEPVVTLYHFDLPQILQDLGGWANPLISDWFADYARIAYSLYADRVKSWITVNEPVMFCEMVYSMSVHPPAIHSPGYGDYLCAKNAMIAHAKAWRIYDEEFKPKYHGRVTLANQIFWYEPEQKSDEEVSELALQISGGIYTHPIYSKVGGWPPSLEAFIANTSNTPGYPRTKLPAFTKEEIELVKGTYDYFGLHYYTGFSTRKARDGEKVGPRPIYGAPEIRAVYGTRPEWFKHHNWFFVYPPGLRKLLNWIKKQYGDIEIVILEHGFLMRDTKLNDMERIQSFKDHLEQVVSAINEDGINVTAFTIWSLIDSFEWTDGYDTNFGLYAVDFSDPLRKRTPRASAHYYAHVIKNHSLDVPEEYWKYGTSNAGLSKSISYFKYLFYVFLYVYYI